MTASKSPVDRRDERRKGHGGLPPVGPDHRGAEPRSTPEGPSLERKRWRLAYLFILPSIVFMLVIHFVPSIQGLYMAFLKLNQFTFRQFLGAPFVGLDNFRRILLTPGDPLRQGFVAALRNTLLITLLSGGGSLTLGMAVALLLNRQFRGRTLVRTSLLIPMIIPSYVVGLLWGFMWRRDFGFVNYLLVDVLGLLTQRPSWLSGFHSLWAVIVPSIWRGFPFAMLLLLARMQTIPDTYYEAAAVDGAGRWHIFWRITVPLLRPVIGVILLFNLILQVYSFNIVYMMFGHGAGYPGEWADILATFIYRHSFNTWQFGTGAAASLIMVLFVLILIGIWYLIFRRDLQPEESAVGARSE